MMPRGLLLTAGALAGAGATWLALRQRHTYAHARARSSESAREARAAVLDGRGRGGQVRRVVILGAGFGGIAAADRLTRRLRSHRDVEVVLVDRDNYHLFTPMLYQVATGGTVPNNIIFAARLIATRHDFHFRSDAVTDFDLERRLVLTEHGPLSYNYLVVALGSVNNFFGIAGAAEHTYPLKSLADAITIRNRVIDCFEMAARETDERRRRALLRFLVVGAGATGVEFVASLQDAIAHSLFPVYPEIAPEEVSVELVEALPEILRGMPRGLADRAQRVLEGRGVLVRLNTAVAEIGGDFVRTKDGETIEAHTVVWAAGVKAVPLAAKLPGEKARDGRVAVDDHLRLPDHPEVFVLGDCARSIPPGAEDGKPLPPNAPVAIQQGEYVADQVAARLGAPIAGAGRPFRYRYRGEMVALSRNDALAHVGPLELSGVPGFLMWRLYYFSQLMGFKNRTSVFVDWISTYLFRREIARLPVERATAVAQGGEARTASARG
jgi:NADH dehydrogenase